MMRLLVLPLALVSLVTAQAQSQSGSNGASVSTILSTSVGLGADRQTTTQVITSLATIQPTPASSAAPAGNSTTAGNSTVSGNSTTPAGNTTSSVAPSNLPTANPSVDGGGVAAGAPSPGGGNGAYGPGDNFIAGALVLKVNAALIAVAGVAVGMAVVL